MTHIFEPVPRPQSTVYATFRVLAAPASPTTPAKIANVIDLDDPLFPAVGPYLDVGVASALSWTRHGWKEGGLGELTLVEVGEIGQLDHPSHVALIAKHDKQGYVCLVLSDWQREPQICGDDRSLVAYFSYRDAYWFLPPGAEDPGAKP